MFGFTILALRSRRRRATLTPVDLVMRKPQPRTIKVEGPDGQPVSGANISPRSIYIAANRLTAELPPSLAKPLGVTTAADGQAKVDYLLGSDKLASAQFTHPSIGTQDFRLLDIPRRDPQGTTITIRLNRTSNLAGRIRTPRGGPLRAKRSRSGRREMTWFPRISSASGTAPCERLPTERSVRPTTCLWGRTIGLPSTPLGWSRLCRSGSRWKQSRGYCFLSS